MCGTSTANKSVTLPTLAFEPELHIIRNRFRASAAMRNPHVRLHFFVWWCRLDETLPTAVPKQLITYFATCMRATNLLAFSLSADEQIITQVKCRRFRCLDECPKVCDRRALGRLAEQIVDTQCFPEKIFTGHTISSQFHLLACDAKSAHHRKLRCLCTMLWHARNLERVEDFLPKLSHCPVRLLEHIGVF